jgi:hypothetical protein
MYLRYLCRRCIVLYLPFLKPVFLVEWFCKKSFFFTFDQSNTWCLRYLIAIQMAPRHSAWWHSAKRQSANGIKCSLLQYWMSHFYRWASLWWMSCCLMALRWVWYRLYVCRWYACRQDVCRWDARDEVSVDEMSVDEMSVDDISVNEMSVDEMPVTRCLQMRCL